METTTAAASGAGMNGLFLIMIIFLGVFMFLTSRSQKKRDNEQKQLIKSLEKGDKVIFAKYAGAEVKVQGEEYLILSEKDILAIITK